MSDEPEKAAGEIASKTASECYSHAVDCLESYGLSEFDSETIACEVQSHVLERVTTAILTRRRKEQLAKEKAAAESNATQGQGATPPVNLQT